MTNRSKVVGVLAAALAVAAAAGALFMLLHHNPAATVPSGQGPASPSPAATPAPRPSARPAAGASLAPRPLPAGQAEAGVAHGRDARGTEWASNAVSRLTSPTLPPDAGEAEIQRLAGRADPDSTQALMAVADARTYLSLAAVTALGETDSPAVVAFLHRKLSDPNPRLVAAAAAGLAKRAGDAAVPWIAQTLAENRQRPDGFQDIVCEALVEALGSIGSAKAIPALVAELRETAGVLLNYDYGSAVVQAMGQIRSADAKPALKAYASRLRALSDGMDDNPLGQHFMREKADEAEKTLRSLGE